MPPIRRNRNQPKPISVSCTTILDLHEHCLLDIFGFLSPLDMCSVFDTCQRFRTVARIHMTSFYRSNELIVGDQATNGIRMLCKFGAAVTKLRMELWRYQHCKAAFSWFRKLNPKLDSLTLLVKDLNAAHMLRPMLGNLRQFRIEYVEKGFSCDIRHEETIKDLLKACKNVEELSFGVKSVCVMGRCAVMGSQHQGIFLHLKFKRIRSLEIYAVRGFDFNNLKIFLKLNPSVQRISIKRCIGLDQLATFNLSQYAPNLEAVTLQFKVDLAMYSRPINLPIASMLSQLEKLKCLALQTCYTGITNFIASLARRNTLVYLSLTHVIHAKNLGLGSAFANMTNLKVLRLHIIFNFDETEFITQMCKNLVSLEELHLLSTYITTKGIGVIIENSVNLKKIYFSNNFAQVEDGVFNKDTYGDFVRMQSRKNVPFPLTLFFSNNCFCVVMVSLRNALNRDVINVSEFGLADFDWYNIPHSIL
ncbi:hypothetical protein HA402_010986 [Bradysia odoriphaga]|nr:hypothetical protein HA402_010986 [Bradysia odoriphaga]